VTVKTPLVSGSRPLGDTIWHFCNAPPYTSYRGVCVAEGGVMSDGYVGFCTKCGTRFDGPEVFCTKCGAPREHAAPAESQAAPGPTLVQQAGQAAATASRAYGTVARVAGVGGMGVALPWQTVTGGQQPDIRAFISAAALPAAQGAIRASLKKPGIAMAVTATLDLVVSGITRGWGGVLGALPRFLLGGATALFSLITGSKGGPLRKLTGVIGGVTAVVQLGFTGYTLVSGVLGGTSVLMLIPQVIAMVSSLTMAVKTAATALKGGAR